jgi:hypothetical protein
VTCNEH